MELTDEEVTKRVIKSINDLKIAKIAMKKIYDKTNLDGTNTNSNEFTVVTINRLQQLEHIEKVFYEIAEISKNTYSRIKGKSDVRQNKGNCNTN